MWLASHLLTFQYNLLWKSPAYCFSVSRGRTQNSNAFYSYISIRWFRKGRLWRTIKYIFTRAVQNFHNEAWRQGKITWFCVLLSIQNLGQVSKMFSWSLRTCWQISSAFWANLDQFQKNQGRLGWKPWTIRSLKIDKIGGLDSSCSYTPA